MKKVLICFLIMFFTIGCGINIENNNSNNSNNSNKSNNTINVSGYNINLKYTSSLHNMQFKYPEDAITNHLGTYFVMDYMNQDEFIFRVAIAYFTGKTIDKVMEGSQVQYIENKMINNRVWSIYEGLNNNHKLINYATDYNGDIYTITFESGKDINNFIDAFMNNVSFN